MLEGLLSRDAKLGTELQHSTQQLETDRVDLRQNVAEVLGCVDGEVGLVLRELGDAWPRAL